MPAIEQHVDWIAGCLEYLRERGLYIIEATPEAEEQWARHCVEVAEGNLRSTCYSWYVGANIPGKARVLLPYIGGFPLYTDKCWEVVDANYAGFSVR